jgi:2-keto-3-deoxy-L-rhamnonate aldolase
VRLFELSSKIQPTDAEIQERRLLQFKVSSMEELVVKFGTVGIKDAISRLRGFGDTDGTRLPLVGGIPGGDAEWAKWKGVIDAVDEVEKSL